MQKQAQYEQGVQKIQSAIDNVAGLDIYKDVDKNYLQSKLNQLGGNLTGLAAGDFSNFQLVNSVAGMTNQIIKDSNVQNAVSSTAWYKKQQKAIEDARKKGKSDKNNEEFFYDGANKWINDNTVGTKFSESFTEYTDIMKTIRENMSAAGIDSKYIEQIYETDSKGNILRDKDNHPIAARVMATETLDTNAENVKAIVGNVLSRGDVQKQIYIDGWANTRNVPVENVYKTFENDFNTRLAINDQELLSLQSQLDATNISDEEKTYITNRINTIKNLNETNRKKLNALKEQSISDPEQFKIDYYQDGYTNNLINGFTTIKSKKEQKDNPLRKQLNWEEQMDFNRNKEAFDRKIALASAARDNKRLEIEQLKFSADYEFDPTTGRYKKVDTTTGKKKDVNTTTTSEINAENKGEPIDAENNYRNVTSDLQVQAQAKGFDLIYTYIYKLQDGKNKNGGPLTKSDVQSTINTYAKANGETPYQFIMRFSGDLKNKSELNGVKLSIQDLEKVNEITKLHNDITSRLAVTEYIYRQTKNETGLEPKDYQLSTIQPLAPRKFLGIDVKQGPEITVQDQLDYIIWRGGGLIKNSPEAKTAIERINKKFGSWTEFENYAEKLQGGLIQRLSQLASNPNLKKYNQTLGEKFKKVNVVSDNFSATLSGSDEERKEAKGRLAPLFNVTRMDEDEQNKLQAALTEPGSYITYDARRPTKEGEPWSGKVFLIDTKGNKFSVDVNQANLEAITGRTFNRYVEDGLRARANVSEYGSTNLGAFTTDPNAYTTAAIPSGRFASLKDSDYTAYADIVPLSGGKLGIAIYAKDKNMSKFERIEMVPVKKAGVYFTDYNEIASVIPNITPAMIKNELIKLKQK